MMRRFIPVAVILLVAAAASAAFAQAMDRPAGPSGSDEGLRGQTVADTSGGIAADVPVTSSSGDPSPVGWIRIADAVQPATAGFVDRALSWAQHKSLGVLVIALDTPGGLDLSMRQMIKGILSSPVPVVVFVYPPGSRAASAGVFLMMAAHVAAMAPGTNLGAAHPVAIGGGIPGTDAQIDTTMLAKVTNDAVAYVRSLASQRGRNADWAEKAVRQSVSVPADEARALNVIDLIAGTPEDLLQQIDGRVVDTAGGPRTLATAGAAIVELKMNLRDQVLGAIANPNIAYMLLLLGVLGIFFELSHPGALFPGIVGGLALLLAFFALQLLPVRAVGVALIVLAVILFILEIKVTSFGALAIGGIAALLFGSFMLFEKSMFGAALSLGVIVPSVVVVAGLFLLAVVLAIRAQTRRSVTGAEGLVGEVGEARTDLAPEGRVFVHGEIWTAVSFPPVTAGKPVRVRRVNGNRLEVEPVTVQSSPPAGGTGR
ncbi:MAG: nodulation protein NfeD [Candidatus Eisenbacteria bacterium]